MLLTPDPQTHMCFAVKIPSSPLYPLSTRLGGGGGGGCRDLCTYSHKSISGVRHWCCVSRSLVQSVFQFIPNMFSRVEVSALCKPLEFFLEFFQPSIHGPQVNRFGLNSLVSIYKDTDISTPSQKPIISVISNKCFSTFFTNSNIDISVLKRLIHD